MQLVEKACLENCQERKIVSGNRDGAMVMIMVKGKW